MQQPHANAGAAVATNGIKLLASPSGGTGGNTISHRILTTHGATSEVFLKHLQQKLFYALTLLDHPI